MKPQTHPFGMSDTKISSIRYPMATGVDGLDQCKFWMISKMNFPTFHDLSLIWWDVQGNAEEFASHSRGSFFWSSLCLCRFWNSGPWEKWIPAKEQTGVDVLLQADIKLSLFIFILISGMGLCVFLLMQCRIEPFRTIGWPHFARCAWADSLVFHCFGHTFEPEIPQKQSDKLFGRPVSQSRFTNKLIRIRNAPLGSMFLRHYFWKNMRK